MARLVRTRRDGTTIFYTLENDHVAQLVIDAVFNAEHAGPGVPGHHRNDRRTARPCTPTHASDRHLRDEADTAHDPRRRTHDRARARSRGTTTATSTGTATRAAGSVRRCGRCSPRTATTPPTASTGRWNPAPPVSARSRSACLRWAPPSIAQLVIVLISGSVALLADTIHNFSDALTAIPLWIAFALGRGRHPPLHLRVRPRRRPRRPVRRSP